MALSVISNVDTDTVSYAIERSINVFVLIRLMCCISGFLATGKLRFADPADVF